MQEDKDLKITDAKAFDGLQESEGVGGVFSPKFSPQQLMNLMGWDKVPKLAKKSYTYDMRKILGQLTPKELKLAAKREIKELKVKSGNAKIKDLMERALCQNHQ